jgi:RNA polymerase sigma-70 factor (ECF subfamily)
VPDTALLPDPSAPDVGALRRLMQAGDPAALDALVRAYGPRLLAVARRACRSAHDAPDAVQQALVNASTAMTRVRDDGDPLAWLSVLVARSCYRLNRDPRSDPARTAALDVDAHEPCNCESPEETARRRELGDEIGRALMILSRVDRVAFLLAAEGAATDEVARELALSSDAVRSRLKRARKILRAHVTHAADLAALPREEKPHAHDAR